MMTIKICLANERSRPNDFLHGVTYRIGRLALVLGALILPWSAQAEWFTTSVLQLESAPRLYSYYSPEDSMFAAPDGANGLLAIYAYPVHAEGGYQTVVAGKHVSRDGQILATYETTATLPGAQKLLNVVPDGEGGVLYAIGSRAYRVSGDGIALWSDAGIELTSSTAMLRFLSDGAGGGIGIWLNGGLLHAQRIDRNGNLLWPNTTDGIPLAAPLQPDDTIIQWDVAADNAGQLYYVYTLGNRSALYAQRLDESGQEDWPGTWLTDMQAPRKPLIVPDEAGGAYLTWKGYGGVRVQHLSAAGAPLWETAATAIPTPSVLTELPVEYRAAADPLGGIVVAWRMYTRGIRAQRVSADGSVLWNPPPDIHALPPDWSSEDIHQLAPILINELGDTFITWSRISGDKFYIGPTSWVQKIGRDGVKRWSQHGATMVGLYSPDSNLNVEIPQLINDGSRGVFALALNWWASFVPGSRSLAFSVGHITYGGQFGPFDLGSRLQASQKLWIRSDWEGYQVLVWRYGTSTFGSVTPYQTGSGYVQLDVKWEEWSGAFLYDYAEGRYKDAQYTLYDALQ